MQNGVGVGVGVTASEWASLRRNRSAEWACGVGLGVGVGVGAGVAVAAPTFGRTAIWAVADWVNVTVWPPKNADRIGVSSVKWPTTRTSTWLPSASEQGDGVQVSETSAGLTVMNEPEDSVRTAHITRLVAALHGWPATNDVGLDAASRAPARAALSIATWRMEQAGKVRPRQRGAP